MNKKIRLVYLLIGLLLPGLVACGETAASVTVTVRVDPTPVPVTAALVFTATSQPSRATTTSPAPAPVPTTVPATATSTAEPLVIAARLPTGSPDVLNRSQTLGDLKLELEITPAKIGNNTFIVRLSRVGTEQAITNARIVRVDATMLDMDMGVAKLELKPLGAAKPGLYAGEDYLLSMYGKYRLDLLVQVPGHADFTTSFEVSVTTS